VTPPYLVRVCHLLPGHAHPVLHHAQGCQGTQDGEAIVGVRDGEVMEPGQTTLCEGGSLQGPTMSAMSG
jgi:hypothetical protein